MEQTNAIAQKAYDLMVAGYSCSEAVLIAVGDAILAEPLDDRLKRTMTAWGGGLGGTQQEVCGALTGAITVISAQHGRTQASEDNTHCRTLAAEYRALFAQQFGHTRCIDLLNNGYGGDNPHNTPCKVLVQQATQLLVDMLEAEETESAP